MEPQGQNGRREMYILSLDNNRIFWILSIALLVLVFLFLLGYWIGHDNTGPVDGSYRKSVAGQNDDRLTSLKKMLDDSNSGGTPPAVGGGGLAPKTADGDKMVAPAADPKTAPAAGDPPLKTDSLTTQEKRELDALKKRVPVVKKAPPVVKRTAAAPRRRPARKVVRKAQVRRSSKVYAPGGKYAIQVASLSSSGNAQRLKTRLSGRSYRAYVRPTVVKGKRYYRIKVGQFASYSSARKVLASLKRSDDGRGSFIVTN